MRELRSTARTGALHPMPHQLGHGENTGGAYDRRDASTVRPDDMHDLRAHHKLFLSPN
jgi:hypothetical protein